MAFRQQRVGSSDRAFARSHQFATETANRRFDALEHSTIETAVSPETGIIPEIGSKTAAQTPRAAHLFAQPLGDWHRDWDRRHDHWCMGTVAASSTASWFIYDIDSMHTIIGIRTRPTRTPIIPMTTCRAFTEGDGRRLLYDRAAYDSSDQSADSTVAAAQEQLARQGYYRENSTASSDRKPVAPLSVIKVTTAWA